MKVTILGNNSALPAYGRHPTAQVVTVYGNDLLLDCGEGTQIQMQRYGVKWRNLSHVFISHLHGDHCFGLPGLLTSMSLLGRTAPLDVYGPAGLGDILATIFTIGETVLAYPYTFHALPEGAGLLVDNDQFSVSCFPTEHRVQCHGFVVERKTKGRKLLPDKAREYAIPAYFYDRLKKGEDYTRADGTVVKNEWVTEEGPSPKRYAFCADTKFTESFLPYVEGVDMLYHESTFLHEDLEKATLRHHTTARQAAEFAVKAKAGLLLIGHYSSRYQDTDHFQKEAAEFFPNVIATTEGAAYEV